MTKARLLQAVCAVALLASAPVFAPLAFAQSDTQAEDTGANNKVNAPVADTGAGSTPQSTMSPASRGTMHHSMMGSHSTSMMHAGNSRSQDAAVDDLNDRSFRAAQQGQSFSAANSGSGAMTAPGMSSGGSMPANSGDNGSMPANSGGAGGADMK